MIYLPLVFGVLTFVVCFVAGVILDAEIDLNDVGIAIGLVVGATLALIVAGLVVYDVEDGKFDGVRAVSK